MDEFILFADETNLESGRHSRFFIYGGVLLPARMLPAVHAFIEGVRQKWGFSATDEFKFDTNSRPSTVSIEQHTAAKQEVLEGLPALGVQFMVYVVHHGVAFTQARSERVAMGANTVIAGFHRFLGRQNATGICILDRQPEGSAFRYLEEKFQRGLFFPNTTKADIALSDRIKLFAFSSIGASHAASVADIVLGAFRYCANEPANQEAAQTIFPLVAVMIVREEIGGNIYLANCGFFIRPTRMLPRYRAECDQLLSRLRNYL